MATLTPNVIKMDGTKPTFGAAAGGGDKAQTGQGMVLIAKNTTGSSITMTIAVPGNAPNGQPNPDTPYLIPATTGEAWAPLPDFYIDPVSGLAEITYSAAGLSVALVRMTLP